MRRARKIRIHLVAAFLCALPLAAQQQAPPHDISKVDPALPGAAGATPLPEQRRRQLKRYDLPELAGATQALGSQLIDGKLPKPLVDFISHDGVVEQRISIFEKGLAVVYMTGASTIFKKVLLPADALKAYASVTAPEGLRVIRQNDLPPAQQGRRATLRVYDGDGTFVERSFHPGAMLPKEMHDRVLPLQDLLRAISEDRMVTSSIAGYEPQPGDELVGDDQRVYRVTRVVEPAGVVELKCLNDPVSIFVAKKDMAQYFVGRKAE
ncbi:MAG TPA: hypothetical protein VFN10_14565 [Thermoanaerobaculia bacterium]|nr:hypothetical protein [Thermoanaerobaculia bacterium]